MIPNRLPRARRAAPRLAPTTSFSLSTSKRCCTAIALCLLLASAAAGGVGEWTSQGPYGGDVPVLALDPQTPSTLYAGTRGAGVFKSLDGAESWHPSRRGLPREAAITALAVDPVQSATLYAAAGTDGVFKTTDGGGRWRAAGAGLPAGANVVALALDPQQPSTLYAGTRSGGLYRSATGGATWQAVAALSASDVRAVAVDPTDPATLYAATGDGVYRSADAAASWQMLAGGLEPRHYDGVRVDPVSPGTVYALSRSTSAVLSGRLFVSHDGGATWQRLSFSGSGFIRDLAIDPADPSTLYAATSSNSSVYKSTDGGATWSAGDGITSLVILSLAVDPLASGTVYAGTDLDHGVFKSTDGGAQWSPANQGLANTLVQDVALAPADPSTLYASSNAGVFRSTDGNASWAPASGGLGHTSVESLAVDPTDPATAYAGSDLTLLGRGVFKTSDGGGQWQNVLDPFPSSGSVEDLEVDPQNPATVYAATADGLHKSTDGGTAWTRLEGLPSDIVIDLAIDPQTPSTLYASTLQGFSQSGRVSKSTDGGASWHAAGSGLPGGFVLTLAVDPAEPLTVYAAGLDGVFSSRDGGGSWQAASALPGGIAVTVAVDPQTTSTIYASTLEGVAKSIDRGEHWFPLSDGLSHLVVDLEVDPSDPRVLHAGTENGGAVELTQDFDCVPDATTLCIDDAPGDRRFEVSLTWEAEFGGIPEGDARATPLRELGITRGGVLSFFDPSNPELLVKVLDGCGFNDHFWVFYAATTNVGFRLKVLDTVAGVQQIYTNIEGTTAATVTDIETFPTCGLGDRASAAPPPETPTATHPLLARAPRGGGSCAGDATTLCIDDAPGDGRFRITASFDTALGGGLAGDAAAVPLAPLGIGRGGILSFFDPRNPELLVKVLDGCGFNDRFWVFYAATTSAGFTLTVEDTVAGIERVFTNPDLSAAEPKTELDAFATCDL